MDENEGVVIVLLRLPPFFSFRLYNDLIGFLLLEIPPIWLYGLRSITGYALVYIGTAYKIN